MLTSKDIKLLIESFKTRAEADEALRRLREEMATKDMFKEVMTKLDTVYKEVKDMRQEQDIHVVLPNYSYLRGRNVWNFLF